MIDRHLPCLALYCAILFFRTILTLYNVSILENVYHDSSFMTLAKEQKRNNVLVRDLNRLKSRLKQIWDHAVHGFYIKL